MTALKKIAQETGITDAEIRAEWEAIADDPKASLVITAALENDPDLVKGEGLKEVAGLLEWHRKEPGPTGKPAFLTLRMTNVVATAVVRKWVLEPLDALKPGDPAGAQKIAEAINGLRNQWFAKILGLSEADLNQAISTVTKASTEYANNAMVLEWEPMPRK